MKPPRSRSTAEYLTISILVFLTVLLALTAATSLRWPLTHDAATYIYLAFLMNRSGYTPYVDLYDMNTPFTLFSYRFIGALSEYRDLGFRIADLLYLGVILVTTWFWMRKLGKRAAWCCPVLFGLLYLGYGPDVSMKNDYILIMPLSVALLCAFSRGRMSENRKFSLTGLFLGVAVNIKPTSIIFIPPILWFLLRDMKGDPPVKRRLSPYSSALFFFAFGFIMPFLITLIYLARIQALSAFIEITRNYWPIHGTMTLDHHTRLGMERAVYLVRGYLSFGGRALWFAPAGVGLYAALFNSSLTAGQRRRVLLIAGLLFCASIFTLLAGKFWHYHWFVFIYFLMALSSLCVPDKKIGGEALCRAVVMALAIAGGVIAPYWTDNLFASITMRPIVIPIVSRANEIAAFLKEHARPGERVQPMDGAGGAVHAMLLAKAPLATPFYQDYYLYREISNPYVVELRKRFMDCMNRSRPEWVIRVETMRAWPSGPDTTREFRELRLMLDRSYSVSFRGDGYTIYRRID